MASVDLDLLWITPISDVTAGQSFVESSLTLAPVVDVSVRQYAGFDANGQATATYRPVTIPGTQQVAKIMLGSVTAAQSAWLSSMMGQVACFRDGAGTKLYGLFTDATFSPYQGQMDWVGPSFTVQEVTFSEAAP